LNFLLFRLGIIILVVLTLITGIIFYWPFDKLNIVGLEGKIEKPARSCASNNCGAP